LLIALSIPAVQTYIGKEVTQRLNEDFDTDIQIRRLGINWKGEVDIREVLIRDHHKDTLIFVSQLQTDILSVPELVRGDLRFGHIDLFDAILKVKTYKGEDNDNLSLFAEKFDDGSPPSDEPFVLLSRQIALDNGRVRIIDENLDEPEIVDLTSLHLESDSFSIAGPNIDAKILAMSFASEWGVTINNIKGDFSYTPETMKIDRLELSTDYSKISGSILLDYKANGMVDFENNVTIVALFDESEIATNDLNFFYDEFGKDKLLHVNGQVEGTLNDFRFTGADVRMGYSRIAGDFSFKNLLSEESFFIRAERHSISSSYYDLVALMPNVLGGSLPKELKTFGSVTFSGTTSITNQTLETDSRLISQVGNITLKASLADMTDQTRALYKGNVLFDGFDLGKLSGTESLGVLSGDLNFDGKGFTRESLSTKLNGKVESVEFNDYTYTNISLFGNMEYPVFDGEFIIDDPSLQMSFTGLIDVSKDINEYDFEADIEFAELNRLNLFTRDSVSVFAGRVIMDMKGTSVDDAVGSIDFSQTFYQSENDDYFFDDFQINSSFEGEIRTISIESPDIMTGSISGVFKIEDVPALFVNGIGSIYENYQPKEVTEGQYIDYEFEIYNKLIEIFVLELEFAENTRIAGSVQSDISDFILNFSSPEVTVYENKLSNLKIEVNNNNPLYNTYIASDSIDLGFYKLSDVAMINTTLQDTLYLKSMFKGGDKKKDIFNLQLFHTINPEGKSVVGIKRSSITYKDNKWDINKYNNELNKITFDDDFKRIFIDSIILNHENENIKLAGEIRDSSYKNINLRFKDVRLGNISPDIDSLRLAGSVNGQLSIRQKDGTYYPSAAITVDSVAVNEVDFGKLDLRVRGNDNLSRYDIRSTLENENLRSLDARGNITVTDAASTIDMDVDMKDFNLKAFSPLGAEVISNLRGLVTGHVDVTGNYKDPNISGRMFLMKSGLTIPYLNVDIDLDDQTQVNLGKDLITIIPTSITDTKYKTRGVFGGKVMHRKFSDWKLDLNLETDRMLVLDTPPEEDALYYGTAFISGTASIKGPVDELVIDVVATTQEGTTFKIPLSDTESIGDNSFIRFLSPKEKQAIISGETIQLEEVKGLSLNFELDINENAEVEVVVDKTNGSTLKGRGAGILLIEINTLGKFKMWGDFLVIEGVYDFRYGGLIQKTIQVVPGGNIVWEGNPARAQLDLTAKYETSANPSVLLDDPSVNRKIPVEVLIGLNGELSKPDISFEVDFPRTSSTVRSELDYKLQNREQREKQALFLLASGSFVNENFQGANAFSGTIAESVTGLINDIFADEEGKFSVGLNYIPGQNLPNSNDGDQLGISFATQVNERILINGEVGVPVGGINETQVAGDIEVQWLVNEDGSLRINFFNRQADIQFIGEDQIFEQGVGVSYSVDFDTFKELVKKLFGRELSLESSKNLKVVPDDNSIPESFNQQPNQR
jgi:hypothetical protein